MAKWLSSRTWLHYITGYGGGMKVWFSSSPNKGKGYEEENMFLCVNDADYNSVYLDREPYGTWAFPRVALNLCEDNTFGYVQYQVDIGFKFTGDSFETVFSGYIRNLDELLSVFRFLGVSESYLT